MTAQNISPRPYQWSERRTLCNALSVTERSDSLNLSRQFKQTTNLLQTVTLLVLHRCLVILSLSLSRCVSVAVRRVRRNAWNERKGGPVPCLAFMDWTESSGWRWAKQSEHRLLTVWCERVGDAVCVTQEASLGCICCSLSPNSSYSITNSTKLLQSLFFISFCFSI